LGLNIDKDSALYRLSTYLFLTFPPKFIYCYRNGRLEILNGGQNIYQGLKNQEQIDMLLGKNTRYEVYQYGNLLPKSAGSL
jgi:hypothetical protein